MRKVSRRILLGLPLLAALGAISFACGDDDAGGQSITVYSGRSEELIGPVVDRFREETGINIEVRYGDTPELAATILEEGNNSPADVYIAQDAGSLGALASEGKLAELPDSILDRVSEAFRSPRGEWVGVSGRARVVVYNTDALTEDDLPGSILDFTGPEWKGRIGWAPTNGSFQAFVTALRVVEGEDGARAWLEGILANSPRVYENNSAIVQAVANREVEVGFVNHYYLFRFLAEQGEGFKARNYFFRNGDVGGLIFVAGAAILQSADDKDAAREFINFLLNDESQRYFATETYEYPLVTSVQPSIDIPPITELQPVPIDVSSDLQDARGTVALLQETGALP
jgi:iron(III) transport system substrate-binding protein